MRTTGAHWRVIDENDVNGMLVFTSAKTLTTLFVSDLIYDLREQAALIEKQTTRIAELESDGR